MSIHRQIPYEYEEQGYKTREEQIDELVADQMFEVFANERAVKEFVAKDRTLAQKVFDHIKTLINDIKAIYKKLVSTGQYDDIAAWQEDLDSLQKVNDMMLDALSNIEQRKNAGHKAEKNTSDEVHNSTKRGEDITRADIDSLREIGRKSINEFTSEDLQIAEKWAKKFYGELGAKSPFFRAWFGDWRENDQTSITVALIPKYIAGNAERVKQRGTVVCKDTTQGDSDGWTINISRQGETNTISHAGKGRLSELGLSNIRGLIENAVLLDTEVHEHHANNSKSPETDRIAFDHKLYALGEDVNGIVGLYKITVEEIFQDPKHPDYKRFHNLKYIEKVAENIGSLTDENKARHAESTNDVSTTKYSVADLFAFVKKYDAEFQPKSASKIVNADGTPKVMYHGTQSSFTAFDKKKAKSYGYYGKGFYFTDSESHAQQYGNSMAVYLDVKNPLEQGKNSISKKQLRKFLEAVAENEDYDIWNYGTEDIFEIVDSIYKNDAFSVIQDVNATAIGDFAEAIALFNKVNKTSYDGIVTPTETVVYEPTQIKSATDNIGTFDKDNPDIRYSTKRDADYMTVVENGDMETAQRIVDEAAKIAGYEYKLYHQTGNDFTVFDTRHKGAGTGDSETPFGVFMKPSSNNIGLKGQKQMPVYAAIKNPLVVGDRDNLMHELKKDATVNAVQEEIKRVNADYKQRVDQAGKDLQSYLIEYRKKHPDEPRSEIYNDDGFNEIYEREDSLIDEWTATIDKLSIDSKNAITDYLKSQGYDGVIIGKDAGSFGRETKTYIALDNTQVKSADPVTYDDRGDVIPLSQRFDTSEDDIRFATKRYWKPNMPKADLEHIRLVAKNELYKTDNYLDNITKWLYNSKNGKTYFALYSTEVESEPTILYASIDDQAVTEHSLVMSYLDELGDESDDGKAKTFNEILEMLENTANLRVIHRGLSSNRRNGNGDVSVYSRSSSGGLSRALLNCLQDSYERRRSVEKKQESTKRQFSVSEEASDYILDTKEYREIINIVDQRYKLTNKKKLSPKAIDRLAGKLLTKASSKYDREQLTTRLTALFDYMANSNELDWSDVMKSAAEIAHDILSNSSTLDRLMQTQ